MLIGARPVWDEGSGRVTGIEIVPLALLDRPRVDVTLRVSGLFRDSFEAQMLLFDKAVRAVASRGESPEFNPLAALGEVAPARIFGPAAGAYGAGALVVLGNAGRDAIGQAYLDASATAYAGADVAAGRPAGNAFAERVAASQALLPPAGPCRHRRGSTVRTTRPTKVAMPPPPPCSAPRLPSIMPTAAGRMPCGFVASPRRWRASPVVGWPIRTGSPA